MKYILIVVSLMFAQAGFADINWSTYSDKALKQAQMDGKKVVLGFHKKGCSTCAAQDSALEKEGITKAKNTVFLKVQRKNSSHTSTYEKYGFNKRQWAAMVLLDAKGKEIARIDPGTTSGSAVTNFARKSN